MEKGRRTLKKIPFHPSPAELFDDITHGEGWNYKTNKEHLLIRDRALAALLYVGALRISEAIRLRKNQVLSNKDMDHILIRGIKLSKLKKKGKTRQVEYRDATLPLNGERVPFTQLFMEYMATLQGDQTELLFPIDRTIAWRRITALLPNQTCHWLRAHGEDYLYDEWDKDAYAVADYVSVDPRTLVEYILRNRHSKYEVK